MAEGGEQSTLDVNAMTVEEVRQKLDELGYSCKGSKAVLDNRLKRALAKISKKAEKTDDAEDDLSNDEIDEKRNDKKKGKKIDVDPLRKPQIVKQLRQLGLKVSGDQATLSRLKSALGHEDRDDVDDEDDEDDEENEDNEEDEDDEDDEDDKWHAASITRREVRYRQAALTFKDVEDALETFSGDGTENIRRWLVCFEETAEMCRWSEAQKVIYAKRLLRGSAKLFANFECHAKTWIKLKKSLVKEFSKTLDSRQVHKQLSQVKKKNDESYQMYVYRVLELASHADMEIEAKIQYVIDGIQDDETSKTILYGASSIKELRKRLQCYETMKNNASRNKLSSKQNASDKAKKIQTNDGEKHKRCFNCGSKKHMSNECPDKNKGTKCFNCGEFGHVAPKCPKKGEGSMTGSSKARVRCDVLRSGDKKTYKNVEILGKQVAALIDSGSDLHLARSSLYVELGAPKLEPKTIAFDGVGAPNKRTLGRFMADVIIDGDAFAFAIDVIPDEYIGHDLLIGGELSDFAEVILKNRQATVKKIDPEELRAETKDPGWNAVLNINVLDEPEDEHVVSMNHIIDPIVKTDVQKLIESYQPVGSKDSGVKMRLVLKDEVPVHQNPRRLSAAQKDVVNKIVDQWVQDGVVRPSTSEYASPIVLVEKKNGEPRLCVDYRMLNKKLLRDRYPLPLIEDQLDRLQDASIFTTLDLKDGFFHVSMSEESIKYTSFVTPDGQFEFLKVPFGLCNSPAVFQRHVKVILRDLIADSTVLVYLDDLIIPARSERENLEKLKKVLEIASEYGLVINWRKSTFLVDRVDYLGYIVQAGRIQPSEKKTLAVAKFREPTNIKQIRSFLGLAGYFRKFIPQFAMHARPLSNLLKNNARFVFGAEQKAAFEYLKKALTDKPVLHLYRVGAETELHTDACLGGLGAIILQKDTDDGLFHPIYYSSWKTSTAEEGYSSYEVEVLAIIKALKKFRIYLLGIPFKIVTDCRAFVMTMKKKDTCLRVSHWALLLEQFQYTIQHRPGTSMRHVDALSRNPVEVLSVNDNKDTLTARIQKAQLKDPELTKFFESARKGNESFKLIGQGVLCHVEEGVEQLVVPKIMQHEVIQQAHEKGHFAARKTEYLLKQDLWFPGMRQKIQRLIDNCVKCLLAEKKRGKAEGMLHPIEKGSVPLDTYHVDYLGPMPSTRKSYQHIFAVVCAFTKFVWVYPTKSTTAEEVISRLKRQAVIFGNPRRIVSDRGAAFTSKAFKDYCEVEGIDHVLITTGVPRGNGQIERMNRIIIPVLTKLSMDKPLEWYNHIDALQQFLNSSFSRSIGRTPFELMIGNKMKLKDDLQLRELIDRELIEDFEKKRDDLRQEAKLNLLKIQEENRKTFNRHRKKAKQYKEGDLVAVERTQFGPGLKLFPKFLGPYKIVTVMRNNRYKVEKIGTHEGPNCTSSSVDRMKPWTDGKDFVYEWDDDTDSEDDKNSKDA